MLSPERLIAHSLLYPLPEHLSLFRRHVCFIKHRHIFRIHRDCPDQLFKVYIFGKGSVAQLFANGHRQHKNKKIRKNADKAGKMAAKNIAETNEILATVDHLQGLVKNNKGTGVQLAKDVARVDKAADGTGKRKRGVVSGSDAESYGGGSGDEGVVSASMVGAAVATQSVASWRLSLSL